MSIYKNVFVELDPPKVTDKPVSEAEYEEEEYEEYDDCDCYDREFSENNFIEYDGEFAGSELLIAEDCRYSLDDYKTRLNNNVLIVGGSGTGKTTSIVIPNIKQAVGSYIISDPKGNLHKKYAQYLHEQGYEIALVDFTHPERSDRYNPMLCIKSTQDILKMASVIVYDDDSSAPNKDVYWDNMSMMLISSIISYMLETNYMPFNFKGILKLLGECERKSEEDKESSLFAKRINIRRKLCPDSWACSQFANVNMAPDRTYGCIRSTLASKFSKYDSKELQEMMSGNDFNFKAVGCRRTAIFVVVSDTDRTMDNLANLFFTQAIQLLCEFADETEESRLPVPVRFILDDFATNCRIDEFPRMISSIRSRAISTMLMIQSEAQLKRGYGEDYATIISNCDTYAYLGGNDYKTAEAVSKRCNKPINQVLYMPVGSCWVFRRGSQPVFTRTFPPKDPQFEKAV